MKTTTKRKWKCGKWVKKIPSLVLHVLIIIAHCNAWLPSIISQQYSWLAFVCKFKYTLYPIVVPQVLLLSTIPHLMWITIVAGFLLTKQHQGITLPIMFTRFSLLLFSSIGASMLVEVFLNGFKQAWKRIRIELCFNSEENFI